MASATTRTLLLFCLAAVVGCSDSGAEVVADTDGGVGSTTHGAGTGTEETGDASTGMDGEATIRGAIVWVDGVSTEIEVAALHERLDSGTVIQHNCGGMDPTSGVSLAISWSDDTPLGPSEVSSTDGPLVVVGWLYPEGDGGQLSIPAEGEVDFGTIGNAAGDVVEGTASAVLTPDTDDPNDLVAEVTDIEFRCVVSERP